MASQLRLSWWRAVRACAPWCLALAACRVVEVPRIVGIEFDGDPPVADGTTTRPTSVVVTFERAPKIGASLEVSTTLGVLDPGADGASRRKAKVETTGETTQRIGFFPGLVAGRGTLTVRAAPDVVMTKDFDIGPAEADDLLLRTSRDALGLSRATSTELEATLLRREGAISVATRVRFKSCCDLESGYEDCGLYLTMPTTRFTTEAEPGTVKVNASLTLEGERLTRPGGSGPTTLFVDLYAYTNGPAREVPGGELNCLDLKAQADAATGAPDAVVLARRTRLTLTSEKPFEEEEEDDDTAGAGGAGAAGMAGSGGVASSGGQGGGTLAGEVDRQQYF